LVINTVSVYSQTDFAFVKHIDIFTIAKYAKYITNVLLTYDVYNYINFDTQHYIVYNTIICIYPNLSFASL